MQWQEQAIVLHRAPFGESGQIVTVLSESHGLHKGLLKRKSATPGDAVRAIWTARLPEHLGTWTLEVERAYSASVMRDALLLRGLLVFCELLKRVLTERTPCPAVFSKAMAFLEALTTSPSDSCWGMEYLFLEVFLLSQTGFGLNFQDAPEATEDDPLTYVSPRTGRVVTRSKGAPYHDKLLRLPPGFVHEEAVWSAEDVRDGWYLTEYFLEKNRLPRAEHERFFQEREALKNALLKRFL